MPTTRSPGSTGPVRFELLRNLTLRELRGKFKRTTLGWAWSVLNPLVNLAVYAVVFGVYLRVDPPVGDPSGLHNFAFFLVCGLLPWMFLANGLNGATASFVSNESLVKKVWFPRIVLPTAAVGAALITFSIELVVLSVVLVVAGNLVLPWIPVAIGVIALHAGFVLGCGLVLAALNARFRDVSHFVTILLNVWFYATPILYPLQLVPERVTLFDSVEIPAQDLARLNPMHQFVSSYRDLLYHLRFPSLTQWLAMAILAAVALAAGLAVHRRVEPRLAEIL